MSFLERELAKLNAAIRDPEQEGKRAELFAAQQALSWALEPQGFKPPFDMVMGIPGATKDCPPESRPVEF